MFFEITNRAQKPIKITIVIVIAVVVVVLVVFLCCWKCFLLLHFMQNIICSLSSIY